MHVEKTYSHKLGFEHIEREKPHLLRELIEAINAIGAVECLAKESKEASKQSAWGGLLFSPRSINRRFKEILYPLGWAQLNPKTQKYVQPILKFQDGTTRRSADRFRQMDGLKERVGLEIQFGKYAFMGYDIFSKMIIFNKKGVIDYGIEIVPVQRMIECMSTGVSAFEHLMIDFDNRGEADIDIPVLVIGIDATAHEWAEVADIQHLYKLDPVTARQRYPQIGINSLKGANPGPKPGLPDKDENN